MKNSKEYILSKRGYVVTENGTALNSNGEEVGFISSSGYMVIAAKIGGKKCDIKIHRLQAYQKYGDKLFQKEIVVRHLNGIKTDNSWDNILIGTQSDNMMDVPEQIRIKRAKHAASFNKKYNNRIIKDFHKKEKSYKRTMEKFNISSKGTLNYILNN